MVILFFVPVINLATIGLLCLLPEKAGREPAQRKPAAPWDAVYSIAIAIGICASMVWLSARILGSYGLGLFVALPFCLGFLTVMIFNASGTKTRSAACGVGAFGPGPRSSAALIRDGGAYLPVDGASARAAFGVPGRSGGLVDSGWHWRGKERPRSWF